VVILLGHCISLFFKPPVLFQSATKTKRKEKGQKTLFLSSKSLLAKRVCFCVFARACDTRNVMNEF
jgi:hypothetical protein